MDNVAAGIGSVFRVGLMALAGVVATAFVGPLPALGVLAVLLAFEAPKRRDRGWDATDALAIGAFPVAAAWYTVATATVLVTIGPA